MYLLVGLGNPGAQYAPTRHNVGFWLADTLQRVYAMPPWQNKFQSLTTRGTVGGAGVVLLKPQTYMNLSGAAVQAAAAFYKIPPENILVAHDELDLPTGKMRYKSGGGDAGHNGLKSITKSLGSAEYGRLRIGIGRPVHKSEVSSYVLSPPDAADELTLTETVAWLVENLPPMLENPVATLAKRAPTA